MSNNFGEHKIGNDMIHAQCKGEREFHQMAVSVVREPSTSESDFSVFERRSEFAKRFDILKEGTFGSGPSKTKLCQYPERSAVVKCDFWQHLRQRLAG